jgi:uncharacterized protein (TIGR03435 family)
MRAGTLKRTARVRLLLATLIASIPGAIAGRAQTAVATVAATKLAFDVASVRQNKSGDKPESNFPLGPGDMYAQTGGVFSASDQTLITYIAFAYKLTISQAETVRQHLPEWVMSDRFDIEARTEVPAPTKDQMRAMMRVLLADRFQLKVHDEARQLPVFGLVLAKPGRMGPKLAAHAAEDAACSSSTQPGACGGLTLLPASVPGGLHVAARAVTMDFLARSLMGMGALDRPVVDQTGLVGTYDFEVEYARDSFGADAASAGSGFAAEAAGPTFLEALREQLGLKLVAQKGPVEVVIVDAVARPSEN